MSNIIIGINLLVIGWSLFIDFKYFYWYYKKEYAQIINYNIQMFLIALTIFMSSSEFVDYNDIIPALAIAFYILLISCFVLGVASTVIVFKAYKMKKIEDGLLDGEEVERKKKVRRKIYLYILIFIIVVEILYKIEQYFHWI